MLVSRKFYEKQDAKIVKFVNKQTTMTVQYIIDTKGKKKGVFVSLNDWLSLQKELDILHKKIASIDKRRKEIKANYLKSKTEKKQFSSDINDLKSLLK
jgi:hypothetical protein